MFYKRITLALGWKIDYREARTARGLLMRQVQQVKGRSNGGLDSNGDVQVVTRPYGLVEIRIYLEGIVKRIW